jgi:hypothetical protein
MKESEPARIPGKEGLEKLVQFTRRILAVPKEEISEKVKEPIYKRRKPKQARRSRP